MTPEELKNLKDNIDSYTSVISESRAIESMPELYDYINQILDWREDKWVELLTCAETFEIGPYHPSNCW